jgi:hypothetical protein
LRASLIQSSGKILKYKEKKKYKDPAKTNPCLKSISLPQLRVHVYPLPLRTRMPLPPPLSAYTVTLGRRYMLVGVTLPCCVEFSQCNRHRMKHVAGYAVVLMAEPIR